jgi:hypothetical protein
MGPAHESERTLDEAHAVLARRRAVRGRPIGRASARARARHLARKLARIVAAVLAVVIAAVAAGLVLGGLGFDGLALTTLAIVIAVAVFARYPRLTVPDAGDLAGGKLAGGDPGSLVSRVELWLEARRPALPAPAVPLIDRIGGQLDALGAQLEGLDPAHPAAREVRSLVGEHLPQMVDSYCRIPPALRGENGGTGTPDRHLADGLHRISAELDEVTRRLAAGDLDSLAIRGRYLDYRYGGELNEGDNG